LTQRMDRGLGDDRCPGANATRARPVSPNCNDEYTLRKYAHSRRTSCSAGLGTPQCTQRKCGRTAEIFAWRSVTRGQRNPRPSGTRTRSPGTRSLRPDQPMPECTLHRRLRTLRTLRRRLGCGWRCLRSRRRGSESYPTPGQGSCVARGALAPAWATYHLAKPG
jgi:hypothetical protein